jgi:uroporphyrinogen-III decarboxylase
MTPKDKVIRALRGERTDTVPVGLHGWGMYKFAHAGRLSDYSLEREMWKIHGEELAQIEIDFQKDFQPDFMQLAEAFFESKKEIINAGQHRKLLSAVRSLDSKPVVDEFLDLVYGESNELFELKFGHIPILSARFGDEVLIILTTEGPIHDLLDSDGILGFEEGMCALIEHHDMLMYIVEGMFSRQLNYARKTWEYGAHAYSQSFSYLSADLVSPDMYRDTLFPLQRDFYREVGRMGLIPILCSWGYVTPIVKYFREIGIGGLMVEESRKSFTNDIGTIKNALGGDIGLFGNVSGEHTLLHSTAREVRREVENQIESAGRNGGFIVSSGTPIAFGTPTENLHSLIDSAKNYRMQKG